MNLFKIQQLIKDLRDYDKCCNALVDEAADTIENLCNEILKLEDALVTLQIKLERFREEELF